ncbi:hypothetical protein ACFX19_005983 [Malus domestica]
MFSSRKRPGSRLATNELKFLLQSVYLCAEGLSALIAQYESQGTIKGVKICAAAPSVNHLLFAEIVFYCAVLLRQSATMS